MTVSKYNPNKNFKRPQPNHYKNPKNFLDYLPYGSGCHVWGNCFTCPDTFAFNCQYNEKLLRGGQANVSMG
jgi:hypothetical protein